MTLAVTSIQRDRNPWIVEWLAFHLLVGFDEFHVYCHRCTDGMDETVRRLGRHYPVHGYTVGNLPRPQIEAYRHAWSAHGQRVEWMAFLDGDEFMIPVDAPDMATALAPYRDAPLSALAVHWLCYGSSGRVTEPTGLVLENYPRHSRASFHGNRHVKSIVRGGEDIVIDGSHLFGTARGTVDETLRPVAEPYLRDVGRHPTHEHLRINHYAIQSFEFFRRTKQHMGAADANPNHVRPDAWYHEYDRNECDDGLSYGFLVRLKLKVAELEAALAEG